MRSYLICLSLVDIVSCKKMGKIESVRGIDVDVRKKMFLRRTCLEIVSSDWKGE
jgi:hypothetical protein